MVIYELIVIVLLLIVLKNKRIKLFILIHVGSQNISLLKLC
jgi:hypothetical protein